MLAALALALLTGIVFSPVIHFELLGWDDNYNITENPGLNPPTLASVASFWRAPCLGLYAPLSYTVFAGEAALARWLSAASVSAAGVFHAGNLLLHVLCVVLVFGTLRCLINHTAAAWLGAALFALHPIQVEVVAWVTETRGLLAALFTLLALYVYVRSITAAESGLRQAGMFAAIMGCTILALLAKPSAAAVPLLLLAMGLWRDGNRRRLTWITALTAAAAVGFLVATKFLQPDELIREAAPYWFRPVLALDAMAFYLAKLCWPAGLGPDYGWRASALMRHGWAYVICVAPVLLGLSLWRFKLLRPFWPGFALFAAALAPTLGLVPFGFQEISTVADRYAYLALFGVALVVAQLATSRWSFGTGLRASIVLFAFGATSVHQARHWRNDASLFRRMLTINPWSFAAYTNLAAQRIQEGDLRRGIGFSQRAIQLRPDYAIAWYNLGVARMRQGNYEQARWALERSDQLTPGKLQTLNNLGRVLLELKQPEAATRTLVRAVGIDPRCAAAHANLADAYGQREDFEQAEAHFCRALAIEPDDADALYLFAHLRRRRGDLRGAEELLRRALRVHPQAIASRYALGEILALREDWAEAERQFRLALQINPQLVQAQYQLGCAELRQGRVDEALARFEALARRYPNYVDTYLGLAQAALSRDDPEQALDYCQRALALEPGWPSARRWQAWIYATTDEPHLRNGLRARALAEELLAGMKHPTAEILDVLAAAHAESGDYQRAAAEADRAVQIATRKQQSALAQRIAQRAALYRRGQPYRDHPASRVARRAD